MYCGQTGPLSGVIEASQLVILQCKIPVTIVADPLGIVPDA
jgi:hypothetical protein